MSSCARHGGVALLDGEYCDTKEIVVVNRHHQRPKPPGVERFYVARPTALGNPFVIGTDGDRDEVIAKYEKWLEERLYTPCAASEQFARIVEYMMTNCYCELECFCAPQACHAEVIREFIFEDDWLWK